MFTGIIEAIGEVTEIVRGQQSCRLTVAESKIRDNAGVGDSIAVNGVCLTVERLTADGFTADVMPETIRKTSLGSLDVGSPVNLECSLPVSGRLGGHIVSGHVDGVGRIAAIQPDDNAVKVRITAALEITDLMVPKGSIAVDGVSLTVVQVGAESFWVSLIPHTAEETVLLRKQIGDEVNLEGDILGKYVYKFLNDRDAERLSGRQRGEA